MGKIMVTGALGNVGSQVAQRLIECGESVVVAGTHVDELKTHFGLSAQSVRFDFTDQATFEPALTDVDRIFLMRPPQLGNPKDMQPFIEALKRKGEIRLVCFLSLMGIEHNPIPPHYKIEKYIKQAKLPYCNIRPGFFMQNLSGIHAFEVKHFDRIVVPAGSALTSFVDARDVGDISAQVLIAPDQHKGHCYDVTGPEAIDYQTAAKILSEALGRTIVYADPKPAFAQKYWTHVRGLDRKFASVMSMLYLMTRINAAKKVSSDYKEVMKIEPRSFQQFALDNIGTWTQNNQ